jgi:hypothetical protein
MDMLPVIMLTILAAAGLKRLAVLRAGSLLAILRLLRNPFAFPRTDIVHKKIIADLVTAYRGASAE